MNNLSREKRASHDTNTAHNLASVLLLLALLLMLAACGGTTETAEEPLADDGVAAVAPTAEVVEPTADTVAPTAEMVEAAPPDPTAVPPTVAPEPTAAPTDLPATEPAGPMLAEGLCANPYFPVIEGARYVYATDVPEMGSTTTVFTFANVTPTSFDMILGDDEADYVTYTWQCLEDGLLSPNVQLNTGGPEMTIETIESSGITFPNPDNVAVGNTWTTRYVLQTTVADMGAGAMVMNQTMEQVNEIVGIESVTTPYGTFEDAVQVQTIGTMEIITSMGGVEMPAMTVDLSGTSWYVENVGRVRSEDASDLFGTGEMAVTVTELVDIEMP